MRVLPRPSRRAMMQQGSGRHARITPYLFILPYVLVFVIFRLGPSVAGLLVSFTDWRILGTPEWVGLANFQAMPRDPRLEDAIVNTLLFSLMTVPLLMFLGLGLAIFLNQKRPLRALGRVAAYTPYVIMSTVVGVLWTWILEKDFGLLNTYIGAKIPWLVSSDWALTSLVMTTVWWTVGYNMVLFLAGLQDIPNELYESARIDGGGAFGLLRYITIPMLAPTIFLVLLLNIINSFQVFDLVFVMTSGGPQTSTLTLVQYVYITAFQRGAFGYGAAIAFLLFAILVGFALIQMRTYQRGFKGIS